MSEIFHMTISSPHVAPFEIIIASVFLYQYV